MVLTAKEKICFQEECSCNPKDCPYAKGHFDRINEAIFDMIHKEDCFDRVKMWDSIEDLIRVLNPLSDTMSKYMENHDDSDVRKNVLEFYFKISHFLLIYDGMDDDYVMYSQLMETGEFFFKLFCVNPSKKLQSCMQRGVSSILFSATFLPVQYYKNLLGGTKEDYEVYQKNFGTDNVECLIQKEFMAEDGFSYAYCYPGMNKVLQAAGRVIRTEEDIGIVVMLDERFLQSSYQKLFPREWTDYRIVQEDTVAGWVEKFWNEWL